MDELFDDETKEWIEAIEPFFPNDIALARKALRERMGSMPLPDWMFSLLVMVLFDGVAFKQHLGGGRDDADVKYIPHTEGSKQGLISSDFLNDKRTQIFYME